VQNSITLSSYTYIHNNILFKKAVFKNCLLLFILKVTLAYNLKNNFMISSCKNCQQIYIVQREHNSSSTVFLSTTLTHTLSLMFLQDQRYKFLCNNTAPVRTTAPVQYCTLLLILWLIVLVAVLVRVVELATQQPMQNI